jgi:hypothetical protein
MKLIALIVAVMLVSVTQAEDKSKLVLSVGDRNILTYNAGFVPSPKKDAPWYGRSGFIHPVFTPKGRIVTDPFPADHLHQHALMFAWTSAVIDGKKVDFWNSPKKQGRIEHVETVKANASNIVVKLRHIHLKPKKPAPVLNETWEIRLVADAGAPDLNVFDLTSTQTTIGDKPFKLAKYHYGGMCVRGNIDWRGDDVMITSEGKKRIKGNHSRPNWVVMHGRVDGESCGIVAMGHPKNFRHPQPVRLHPKMPYFCFAPMVAGDFQIEPGKPYVSQYRFVTFDGEPDLERIEKMWKAYAK